MKKLAVVLTGILVGLTVSAGTAQAGTSAVDRTGDRAGTYNTNPRSITFIYP